MRISDWSSDVCSSDLLRWLPMREKVVPERDPLRGRLRRGRALLLAALVGSGLAALSYALLTRPAPPRISPFFLQRALPEGGGSNAVNVILVAFPTGRGSFRGRLTPYGVNSVCADSLQ